MASTAHILLPSPTFAPANLEWIKQGYGFSEAQTFYFYPSQGGLVYLQLAYSEVSYPTLSQVTVRASTPQVSFFKSYNYSGSALQTTPNEIGCNSCKISWTTDPNGSHFKISLTEKEVVLNCTFITQGPSFRLGDGKIQFFSNGVDQKSDGFLSQTFGLRAEVKGTLSTGKSMVILDGLGSTVLQHQGFAPYKIANQWNFLNFHSSSLSVATIVGHTPATYKNESFSTFTIQHGDKIYVTNPCQIEFLATEDDVNTGYKLPTVVRVTSQWTSSEAKSMGIEMNFTLNQKTRHMVDILGELPWLVRKAIQLLVSKPYIYQYMDSAELVLKEDGREILREKGQMLFEVSFTNPS